MIGRRRRATRRVAGRWLPALLLLAGCSGGAEPPVEPAGAAPSLLLLTLDTTRADRLEPYGAEDAATPNLAALAAEGVVFERAYAVTPVTLPSHVSIFSGLDPTRHGVRNNGVPLPRERPLLLAEILRAAGLRTAAFVSAAVLERRFGLARGFEVYDDDLAAGGARGARLIVERPAAATVGAAAGWLDGLPAGERFFLWVHLFEPHAAYTPPPPFAERFAGRPYDGEIAAMDAELGRLLRHPRVTAGPVVVMAIGDHGESLGEHGEQTHAMLAYDATLRIPWIVRAPGGGAGRVTAPVSQIDLLPTALELLGIAPPDGRGAGDGEPGGLSLASAIAAGRPPAADRPLYGESLVPTLTYGWAPLHVLRRGPWKLIRGVDVELFDVASDPGELRDLAAAEPARTARLGRELADLLARSAPPADTGAPDRRTAEMLRSLGYLAASAGAAERRRRPDPRRLITTHLAFERAAHLFGRRQLDKAVPELREVLDRDPENLAALTLLARALSGQGSHDEALSLAGRAVALAPADAEARVALGVVQARQGRLEEALATLRRASELAPSSLDARLETALLQFRLGRPEEGEAGLRAVLAEDADNPRAAIALAERVELAAGDSRAAERRLREVVGRDPSRVEGWRALGRVLEETDRLDEAVDTYRRGLAEVPGDGLLHARLGAALGRQGRDGEAEASLRRASELLRPGSASVHGALAGFLLRRGEWAAAAAEARRAVELDPASAPAWNHLAAAREELGEADGAMEAYGRALTADPGFWRAEFNRALLLRRQERWQEAAAGYRAVLRQAPGHAKSHYELGLLYLGPLADRAAAERHLALAIEAEPGHPRAAEARRLLAESR